MQIGIKGKIKSLEEKKQSSIILKRFVGWNRKHLPKITMRRKFSLKKNNLNLFGKKTGNMQDYRSITHLHINKN